jgi:catechol 2,3-dioxygenase-like lactoylglutathione lyase family enzyme
MKTQSAVEFPTPTRIHVAIAVTDVEGALPFYRTLFGQEPTKTRPGYAKFEVLDPPVNFTLNRYASSSATQGPQHFGIQVKSTDAVRMARERLERAGYPIEVEDDVTCCWAVQDKVWAVDPDGHRWEVFVVTDADASVHSEPTPKSAERTCCDPGCCT